MKPVNYAIFRLVSQGLFLIGFGLCLGSLIGVVPSSSLPLGVILVIIYFVLAMLARYIVRPISRLKEEQQLDDIINNLHKKL